MFANSAKKKPLHSEETKNKIYCKNCNRYCFNQDCFNNHNDVCKEVYNCNVCNKITLRAETHMCGYSRCHNCDEIVKTAEHRCYMLPKKSKVYTEKYIWFDCETEQDNGIHKPNHIVAHYFDGTKFCFKTNDEFCEWLISKKKHKGYTAIAHKSKSYDWQFILKYCVDNTLKPYTIYSGTKLMLFSVCQIKNIDSHNFVASPLSAFPKTFGLNELKQWYFPHYFNTNENHNYVGPIPDVKYYGVDTMENTARKQFLKWHATKVKENCVFNFQKEFLEYCDSGVDILRRGCLELRKQFLEIVDIDPFQYITIAGVCMSIYRSKYLQLKTIEVIKDTEKETYSKGSIAWLNTFPHVRHVLNGREIGTCGAKVDGFNQDTNTVYQYHGCFWHGCPECYNEDTINNIKHQTVGDLHPKTRKRSKQIIDAGFTLIEKGNSNG